MKDENDTDVAEYIHQKIIQPIVIDPNEFNVKGKDLFNIVLDKAISDLRAFDIFDEDLVNKIKRSTEIHFGLIKQIKEFALEKNESSNIIFGHG